MARKNAATNAGTAGKNLFPYGTTSSGGSVGTTPAVGEQQGTVPTPQNPLSLAGADRLRELANYAVTDYYATDKTARWNAKQTGLLFDAEIDPNIIVEKQTTKTKAPDAEEVWFGNSGSAVAYRTWNNSNRSIDTLVGTVPPAATVSYCMTTFGVNLQRGSKNSDVKALQVYVNYKMHLGLSTDGSYGSKLATAVTALQKSMQLKQTGIFDDATRGAVNDDCSTAITAVTAQNSAPQDLGHVGFLASNIIRGSVSPDGTKIFYLVPTTNGVSGMIADIDGSSPRAIWSSPLTEWRPQWVNATTIAMTTLATREAVGYMYFLNVSTGNFQKVIGPIRGLTTLVSPDAATVMISRSTDSGIQTGLYAIATGAYRQLDLSTLPEKCFWSSNTVATCAVPQSVASGIYPDDWYQGTVSFTDNLWSIDASSGATVNLLTPPQPFDMIHVRTSPNGTYAYFINKTDGTLWSYRLK